MEESQDGRTNATILVVDDEECLRKVLGIALSDVGYRVLIAGTCDEAVALMRCHADPIDLLLTDMRMPGPDGIHTATEFRKRYPGAPVIFMTAYSAEDVRARVSGELVLSKPFDLFLMLEFVSLALELPV